MGATKIRLCIRLRLKKVLEVLLLRSLLDLSYFGNFGRSLFRGRRSRFFFFAGGDKWTIDKEPGEYTT